MHFVVVVRSPAPPLRVVKAFLAQGLERGPTALVGPTPLPQIERRFEIAGSLVSRQRRPRHRQQRHRLLRRGGDARRRSRQRRRSQRRLGAAARGLVQHKNSDEGHHIGLDRSRLAREAPTALAKLVEYLRQDYECLQYPIPVIPGTPEHPSDLGVARDAAGLGDVPPPAAVPSRETRP